MTQFSQYSIPAVRPRLATELPNCRDLTTSS
jgi:hypothetical protein